MSKVEKVKTDLDYNNGKGILPEGAFRISASQFNTFMSYPHQWFREQVLGESGFIGNTGSVLGTCVHYIAEKVGKGEHPDVAQIEQYIENHSNPIEFPDVDVHVVRAQYKLMGETLVNQYILQNKPYRVEEFISTELYKGIYPSGSCDAVDGSDDSACIVDYKTYSSKTKPKAIPMNYKYQLLMYAYIYTEQGINVDRIRLVYVNRYIDGGISEKTGKPLKSYAPEVTVLTESITKDDLDFIESVMCLCSETYLKYKEDPSLGYLLYRDYRLKTEGN